MAGRGEAYKNRHWAERAMRALGLLALVVLLAHAAPVLAHGEGTKTIQITDTGCSLTDPPCLLPDSGSSVLRGEAITVAFRNLLDTEQSVMVHLDEDGTPGALLTDVKKVAPGTITSLTLDVPADAVGVWFMASGDDGETARLFGPAQSESHEETDEESPAAGAVVALLALAAVAVTLRRKS